MLALEGLSDLIYHLKLDVVGAVHPDFRSAVIRGYSGQQFRERFLGVLQNPEEAGGSIDGVVVSVVFVRKEHVA